MTPKPLAMLLIGTTVGLSNIAIAQNRTSLEEIIVTAQKREEAIQDVPIAITALGADTLEKQGIATLKDLQGGQVPSLKVVQFAGRPNTMQFGIRGVTEPDIQPSVERAIAVYVDNVYIARANGMDTEVFDIERMEILRGPQGTLFGRNAEGGAVNITTRKPTGDFGFKQDLEASSLDEYKARTLIDTPEWNGLSASLGYLHRQANGWIANPANENRDYNWQNKNAYRLALQYKTDDVVVDYAYDNSNIEYMQNYNVLLHKPAASFNPRPVDQGRPDRAWAGTRAPVSSSEGDGHSLTAEWSINSELTLKSITGYRTLEDNAYATGSGANVFLPGLAVGLSATQGVSDSLSIGLMNQNQHSQEIQLIGDTDRLEWQVGALYFHEDASNLIGSAFGYLYNGCNPLAGYGASCGLPLAVPYSGVPNRPTRTTVDTDSYGAYAQATWNPDILEDRLKITLGLRYGKDKKDIQRGLEGGAATDISTNAKAERVDPAVTIAYQLLDTTSIYTRYSTAYRGPGVSMREVVTFTPYKEETTTSTEVGVKSVFWDNRARINAAAFYNEIDQFQIPVQQVCPTCSTANTTTVNARGTARMSGFELDGTVLLIDGLTVSLGYTYLDNSIPEVLDGGVLRQPALNNASRNSWALNVDYAFEPFSFGTLNAHVDVTDSDEYCFNSFSCRQDAVMAAGDITGVHGGDDNRLINARLTLSDIALGNMGKLQAALWAKNLTDEEYINFGFTAPQGTNLNAQRFGNNTVGTYGDPRSVGVTLTYQY
jgi:iron complex outermembrane receptor protein